MTIVICCSVWWSLRSVFTLRIPSFVFLSDHIPAVCPQGPPESTEGKPSNLPVTREAPWANQLTPFSLCVTFDLSCVFAPARVPLHFSSLLLHLLSPGSRTTHRSTRPKHAALTLPRYSGHALSRGSPQIPSYLSPPRGVRAALPPFDLTRPPPAAACLIQIVHGVKYLEQILWQSARNDYLT